MPETLIERLLAPQGAPLLADGAMGTMLHALGAPIEACFDELNLSRPDLVERVHREYLRAGADLIETNSFGANRFKLARHGLLEQLEPINRQAVHLARHAAQAEARPVIVAGSLGPLGVRLAPYGRVSAAEAEQAFLEQMHFLVEAGVDLLIIETLSDVAEALLALRAARRAGSLPVLVSLTFTRDDRTLLGQSAAQAARELAQAGADLIGINCSGGPAQVLQLFYEMRRAAPDARLALMPNAGFPEHVAGRVMYPASPEYFADHARRMARDGARLIGGCCGTSPAHTAAMRRALDEQGRRASPTPAGLLEPTPAADALAEEPGEGPSRLARRLAEGRFVIAVEVDPPRSASTHALVAAAATLIEAGADVIDVADNPMARLRMSAWAVAHLVHDRTGAETVLHFPTRGRSLLRLQGDLLAAHALGIRNLFVVMGDPAAVGDYPHALDNADLVPSGLIRLIKQRFNLGLDEAGQPIGQPTSFFVGGALNPNALQPEKEMRALARKLEAGADFILTQPVFDANALREFITGFEARHGPLRAPLLVGLLPLVSARQAEYLHNEVPGVRIPEPVRARIARAGERGADEGLLIALEVLEGIRERAAGVYIMPPANRYDLAAELVERIRAAR